MRWSEKAQTQTVQIARFDLCKDLMFHLLEVFDQKQPASLDQVIIKIKLIKHIVKCFSVIGLEAAIVQKLIE